MLCEIPEGEFIRLPSQPHSPRPIRLLYTVGVCSQLSYTVPLLELFRPAPSPHVQVPSVFQDLPQMPSVLGSVSYFFPHKAVSFPFELLLVSLKLGLPTASSDLSKSKPTTSVICFQ